MQIRKASKKKVENKCSSEERTKRQSLMSKKSQKQPTLVQKPKNSQNSLSDLKKFITTQSRIQDAKQTKRNSLMSVSNRMREIQRQSMDEKISSPIKKLTQPTKKSRNSMKHHYTDSLKYSKLLKSNQSINSQIKTTWQSLTNVTPSGRSNGNTFREKKNHRVPSPEPIPISQLTKSQKALFEPLFKDGRYLPLKIVGKGTFGTVVKSYCYKTKQIVAIKRISDFDEWEYLTVQVLREVQLLKELNAKRDGDQFVPQLYDVFVHEEHKFINGKAQKKLQVYIVMEYFETDLKQLIQKKIRDLDENKIMQIITDCLKAIQFIHQHNVIHRDIKPANLFITQDLRVKIGDFGISRSFPERLACRRSGNSLRVRNYIRRNSIYNQVFDDKFTKDQFIEKIQSMAQEHGSKDRCLSSHVGSRWYRAPEIILMQRQYDTAQDMWALGCVFFEIFSIRHPSLKVLREGLVDPILFRGLECYPLSFAEQSSNQQIHQEDQILVIIRQLSQLKEIDKCFMDNKDTLSYLDRMTLLSQRDNGQHYTSRLQNTPQHYKMLLKNMLQFNPYMRWSAKECLELQAFANFRSQSKSSSPSKQWITNRERLNSANQIGKICLKIDRPGVYCYENTTSESVSDSKLQYKYYNQKDYVKMIREQKTKDLNVNDTYWEQG